MPSKRAAAGAAATLAAAVLALWLWPRPRASVSGADAISDASEAGGRRKPTLQDLARLALPPPPAPRTGTFEGKVIGPGSGGARVAAECATARQVVTAAADGSYAIADLPPGDYLLSATSADRASEPLGPVPLGPGEEVRGLVLTLVSGGGLEGVVLDAIARDPIRGARLSAGGAAAASGDDGAFVLRGLAPGEAMLQVSADGYVTSTTRVAVPRGRRQTGAVIVLTPSARVEGKVQQADGTPIPGAQVEALRYGFGGPVAPVPVATADDRGQFRGYLEPGRVALFAPVPGGEARAGELDLRPGEAKAGILLVADVGGEIVGQVLEAGGTPALGASVEAVETVTQRLVAASQVAAEGRFQLDGLPSGVYAVIAREGNRTAERAGLRLEPGDQASAQIQFGDASLAGQVIDGASQPVVGAQVSVAPEGSLRFAASVAETDARGAFHVEGLSGQRFALRAVHPLGAAEVHGIAAGSQDVVLRIEGESALAGYVQDDEGHAVTDFRVLAEPVDVGHGGARALGHIASPAGDFHLQVKPGRYRVRVSAAGYATVDAGEAEAPAGGESSDIRVTLRRTRAIAGDVVDAQDGRPISGARVATRPNLLFAFGRTSPVRFGGYAVADDAGHFRILDAEPGEVSLFATADGYGWGGPIHVGAGQDPSVPVIVRLAKGKAGGEDFAGVGMQLSQDAQGLKVGSVFDGGPADLAGVRPGDLIVAVDGTPTAGHSLMDVVGWIRGEVGTPVVLALVRGGQAITLTATRAEVKF